MQSSTFTLDTADGVPVHVYRWTPDGEVRGIVQIAHGMAEHAARYERTAAALTDAGYAVYADDHRGHGRTAAQPEDLGFLAEDRGWNRVLDDLHRLTLRARQEHDGAPVVLLGHSMGSFLAQQYLFTFPEDIVGAALSGSNGPVGALGAVGAVAARAERLRQGKRGRSALLRNLTFGAYNKPFEPARTGFDWLSRDPAEVDAYIADPLCGFDVTNQMWVDVLGGVRVIADRDLQARIPDDLPIYVFSGERDPVGEAGEGVRRLVTSYEEAGQRDVTLRLYPDARHETLNETNRHEVVADLLGWLDRVVGGG